MMRRALLAAAMVATIPSVLALPKLTRRDECTSTKTQRKPWSMLTDDEKSAYIDAELCLMSAPSQSGVEGAESRWDDLQHNHIIQTQVVHDVGQFLPWHRYHVTVHAELLQDECGYTGSIPYWDETVDAELSDLSTADVFQADAFGGDGDGDNNCITTGPFANLTLHLRRLGVDPSDYCLSRSLNLAQLQQASQSNLDKCMAIDNYTSAWECWHSSPHNAGHGGTGGVMVDVVLNFSQSNVLIMSLFSTWLDAQWWRWQSADLDNRLTDMGGRNVPEDSYIQQGNLPEPTAAWTDYFGDDGNVTTLNHVLYASEIRPNVTVGDVMDVGGSTICSEYVYSDE
ncbi:hypothetical protein PFICI_14681 [Pestalotiopsis fici W106-1]|uniref:Tyrosinase copper-binding domain-containing protein n=1 Tax=Pestalotiopsis fici (strain W106-1 / CGMCC3.15140) TaxID=1229662 RepID=W3WIK4_PESFW|nr:uncharacterized protein PFICI_14681 [Pestalotiopsis fici W106-1]ETS73735.1 hypothetical protein PFICI_14681 [Pestalotiopsis fici W106-1]